MFAFQSDALPGLHNITDFLILTEYNLSLENSRGTPQNPNNKNFCYHIFKLLNYLRRRKEKKNATNLPSTVLEKHGLPTVQTAANLIEPGNVLEVNYRQ